MSLPSRLLRFLCLVLAGASFALGLGWFERTLQPMPGWGYMGACLLFAIAWQWGIGSQKPSVIPTPVVPGSWVRVGSLLALGAAALFLWASFQLYEDWPTNFDVSWLTWLGSATALAIGLDLAWGRWPRPSGLWSRADLAIVAALLAVAAGLRIWGMIEFPGPYHVTQIEEAQIGNFGYQYLAGLRIRWEYLSHMWLSAIGQALFTNDLVSVRIPFVFVNTVKLVPLYFLLRWLVGRPGAVVAAALLACSGWDIMLSRIPTNQNELTAAVAFALLAGPARRGRPSAFVFLGFIGGYVVYEYIAYRPLAGLVLLGATMLSLGDGSVGWGRRLLRPAVTLAIIAAMALPLFTGRLTQRVAYEYFDGWNRARGQQYYTERADWWRMVDRRLDRLHLAFGSFLYRGDSAVVRNLDRRATLDHVTAALVVAGIGFAVTHWMAGLVPLVLLAFLVTFTGTLIATGNFDMARAGCNVTYVHVIAGFGAAGLVGLLGPLFGAGAPRRVAVAAVVAVCVAAAAVSNLRFLNEYWHSREVRDAQHLELAYQTRWLSETVRPGEYVIGLSVRAFNVLMGNDASWMRAEHVEGTVAADLWSMIDEIVQHRGEDLFLYVSAEDASAPSVDFLRLVWPQLHFDYVEHPMYENSGFYYARLGRSAATEPPPSILQTLRCRSARGEYVIDFGADEPRRFEARFPFVARATWPQVVRGSLYRGPKRAEHVDLRIDVAFTVEKPGNYVFRVRAREGRPKLGVDGGFAVPTRVGAELAAGIHQLSLEGEFLPTSSEPTVELDWRGPDTGGTFELMPIFKIAPLDPDCAQSFADLRPGAAP